MAATNPAMTVRRARIVLILAILSILGTEAFLIFNFFIIIIFLILENYYYYFINITITIN